MSGLAYTEFLYHNSWTTSFDLIRTNSAIYNEHPYFHQWLTETFQISHDKKALNQAIYILYQSSKTITLQLKINFLQQIVFFNKWKLKLPFVKANNLSLRKF